MWRLLLLLVLPACDDGPAPVSASVPTDPIEETSEEPPPREEPADDWEATSDLEIKGPRARARHILIAYKGAAQAPGTVTRSQDDARSRASEIRAAILAGADFAEQAQEHSDGGTARRGGELGTFAKGVMHQNFEDATFALEVGALSSVVETPFGYHVIERLEVIEIRVAQVLIQWKGRHRAKTTRSKVEARARADEALSLIRKGGSFKEVAKTHSDGGTGKRGTDLGWFQQGQMVPAFEKAAFGLEIGKTSEVIESPLGFHIIHRVE
jgi:peptidyl-prolyl cis-trans isomerase SurA